MKTNRRSEIKDKTWWLQAVADAAEAIQRDSELYGPTETNLTAQAALLNVAAAWSQRLELLKAEDAA